MLAPRSGGVGGIAQHVRGLVRRLESMGHRVLLISSETLHAPRPRLLANPIYSLLAALRSLKGRYDVAHGHNLPTAPALQLAHAEAKILTLHGLYSKQVSALHGGVLGRVAEAVEAAVARRFQLTAVSEEAARHYGRIGARVVHIPNAVELSEMPGDRWRIQSPQVTYLGRLSWEKGVDLLLEAVELGLRGLVVAGDGPMRGEVEKAARKGLLRYLGPLPRARALRLLAGSDLTLLPSRMEGLSTTLLEAMALRVPVVATRVGGTVEVVRDGVEALLVEPRAEEIIEAAGRLLSDRPLAERLTENAYRRVREKYSWEKVAGRYLELYFNMLRNT